MDALESLQAQLRACARCTFGHAVRPVVAGSAHARIMLIGQAPGKTEQLSGQGWMGPAGRRLVGWMTREVGFEDEARFREQVYLAAVTRCYPGPHPKGKGDRKPTPDEIQRCGHWLDQELALVRPALIVLIGGMAIERFLGKVRLEEVVGHAIPGHLADFDTLFVPLPHPSGASTWLNAPSHKALLGEALSVLRGIIQEQRLAVLKA